MDKERFPERYISLPYQTMNLNQEQALVRKLQGNSVHKLDPLQTELLRMLQTPLSLDELIDNSNFNGLRREDINWAVNSLKKMKLIISREDIFKSFKPTPENEKIKFRSIGWITKDFPEQLIKNITGFLEQVETRDSLDVTIAGSSLSSSTSRTRKEELYKILSGPEYHSRQHNIKIIDSDAAESLKDHLLSERFPPDTINFCLFGNQYFPINTGANRNLLYLASTGKSSISIDDDMVPVFSGGNKDKAMLAIPPHCSDIYFYKDRKELLSEAMTTNCNIIVEFENLYNFKWKNKLNLGSFNLSGISAKTTETVFTNKLSIDAAYSTRFGDCGIHTSYYNLFLTGDNRKCNFNTIENYNIALKSREQTVISQGVLYSDSPHFATSCSSYSNKRLLPPFFPIGRFQDAIFGILLRKIYKDSLIGRTPVSVLNNPSARNPFTKEDRYFLGSRSADLLIYILEDFELPQSSSDYSNNIKLTGTWLRDHASLNDNLFYDFLIDKFIKGQQTRIDISELYLGSFNNEPQWWADDMHKMIEKRVNSIKGSQLIYPVDIRPEIDPETALSIFKKCIFEFGTMMELWNEITEASYSFFEKNPNPLA